MQFQLLVVNCKWSNLGICGSNAYNHYMQWVGDKTKSLDFHTNKFQNWLYVTVQEAET